MPTYNPEHEDHRLDSLIRFFSRPAPESGKIISHPDPRVEEMSRLNREPLRKASVLIPVIKPTASSRSHIVLTLRSDNLNSHAGQVSFPGGSREHHDSDNIETALRESEEEIGLNPDAVEIIGQLGEFLLPSGFEVTPVIGLVEPEPQLTPCPIEVNEIFMAPTELLLDPEAYTESIVEFAGQPRKILELYYEGYRIWGATAVILHHLATQINIEAGQ
ncbi:MAG: CoA pyrophosphatase [Gammaproteobacteria bacterium]|nr:CoA pyrophosphatase [Gammaproteobacteria bacterium]